MSEEIKNNLVEHFRKSQAPPFLFIGSGFSRRYIKLDDWEGVLRKFCKGIEPFEYYLTSADGDLPQTATLMASDFNKYWWKSEEYSEARNNYKTKLKDKASALKFAIADCVQELSMSGLSNSEYPDEIKMLSKLNVDGIITTNWDTFIEQVFPDYRVYVGQEELLFSNPQSIAEIYKIHGCSTRPDSMVLTSEDYEGYISKNAYLAAKLITLFVEHPIVFIGYSITDNNIRELLKSIIKCVGEDDINKIRDNLIFVQRSKEGRAEEISDNYFMVDSIQVPVKVITTESFLPVYEAIDETKRRIPSRILRYCKEQLYDLVKSNAPEEKLCVVDYEEIEDKKDVEFVVGLGVVADQIAMRGYSRITAENVFSFLVEVDQKYDCHLLLSKTLPDLLKRSRFLPKFKFFREHGIDSQQAYEASEYQLEKSIEVKPEDYKSPIYESNYNNNASGKSLKEIIDDFSPEKVAIFVPFIPWEDINPEMLRKFLAQNIIMANRSKSNHASYFRKLACLYDHLAYGWAT